jgi:hypothetical protein
MVLWKLASNPTLVTLTLVLMAVGVTGTVAPTTNVLVEIGSKANTARTKSAFVSLLTLVSTVVFVLMTTSKVTGAIALKDLKVKLVL